MKPIADWTLAEVKTECFNRQNCKGCPLWNDGNCRVNGRPPFALDLNEKESKNER